VRKIDEYNEEDNIVLSVHKKTLIKQSQNTKTKL